VLVDNAWELLEQTELDGVHFDSIPENYSYIVQSAGRPFYRGLTCTNDLSLVRWADTHQLDYISFCSLFPTVSAPTCTLVDFDSVRQARQLTSLPLFVAGGISLQNIHRLSGLPVDGIALISGIMAAADITGATKKYVSALNKIITSRQTVKQSDTVK
jgi:thiamine-phosphate pyrophosphorylase